MSSSLHENDMSKISHKNTFYFLRYAHVRYVKMLQRFRNNRTFWNLAYFLRNLQLLRQIFREFLGLRMRNLQDIDFIWTQTYREFFRSALNLNFSIKDSLKCIIIQKEKLLVYVISGNTLLIVYKLHSKLRIHKTVYK